MEKLSRTFYIQEPVIVAKNLLGKYLYHLWQGAELVGKIVEVEAYLGPHDLASHSSKGITPRTKLMFGLPGHAYIYLIYGMYHCLNVVTEPEGMASAVLVRALEPIKHIDGKTSGPGLLCRAMHIDLSLNGHDLVSDNFYIAENREEKNFRIVKAPRIGVAYAGKWAKKALRFYIKNNPFVSRC